MRKLILILGLALILANLAFASDKEIFKSQDNNVVILSDGCTATTMPSENIETPEGGTVRSTAQTTVKCTEAGSITVKKDNIVIGNMRLTSSMFKIDNSGKYAGVIYMVTPLDQENDNEIAQSINGMLIETSKGTNIDFWNGKDTMDKKYDQNYFNNFLYKLAPTTLPEPVKDNEGKVILDPNPAFAGKNVPKNVVAKFRSVQDEKKLPALSVCGQEFYYAWAETLYGPSTSSAAGSNPNTLSGRKVVSQQVTEIFVEKEDSSRKPFKEYFDDSDIYDKSNCIAKSYTLSTNGQLSTQGKVNALYTLPASDKNYCGVFFIGPYLNNAVNIKCKQNIDVNGDYKAELSCDNQECRTSVVAITQKLNNKEDIHTNAFFMHFNKENPLYKITTTMGSEDNKAQHEVELDAGGDKESKEPKGIIIYDQNHDIAVKNPIIIGINMRSEIVMPAGYRWFGGAIWPKSVVQKGLAEGTIKYTRGGEYPSQIFAWQAPVTKEEKKAAIVPKGDHFSVLLKGGNVVFTDDNVRQNFLLSNKYQYEEDKKSFPGYEIKIKSSGPSQNVKVFEIAKIDSAEKKVVKIEGVDIRELKTNVETPILAGVKSAQMINGNPVQGTACSVEGSSIGIFINNEQCGKFSGLCDAKTKLCIKIGCDKDADCSTGYACSSNICSANSAKRCNQHSDCGMNFECDKEKKVCFASKCDSNSACLSVEKNSMCSMLPSYDDEGVCVKKSTPGIFVGNSVGLPDQVTAEKYGYTPSVIIMEPLPKGETGSQANAYFIYKTNPQDTVKDVIDKFSPCMGQQANDLKAASEFETKLRSLNDLPSDNTAPLGRMDLKVPNFGYSYNKGVTQFNINRCVWVAKESIANAIKARVPQGMVQGATRDIREYVCQNDEACITSRGKCKNIVNGMGNCARDENLKIVKKGSQFCIDNACIPMCKDGDAGFPQPKYQKSFATTYMLDKNGELFRLPMMEDVCGTKERGEQNVLFEATCQGEDIRIVPTPCDDGCANGKCNLAKVAEQQCKYDRDCDDLGQGYECVNGECIKRVLPRSTPTATA
ncbi:MAG: hypothetical protein V1906_02740 [Candidatus Woesearchaeota archaeon]